MVEGTFEVGETVKGEMGEDYVPTGVMMTTLDPTNL